MHNEEARRVPLDQWMQECALSDPLEPVDDRLEQDDDDQPGPLLSFRLSDLAGLPVPERRWIVPDLIPEGTVTLLGGDGGIGKSLLSLQLAVARNLGGYWAGKRVEAGHTIFYTAEDGRRETHIRSVDVAHWAQVGLADLPNVEIIPIESGDALLAIPAGRGGKLKTTARLAQLEAKLQENPGSLLILDTLADVFGGDENIRSQARQFIGILRGLCVRHQATVLLLSHPSVAGMASGSGLSGSTAWNNSVRSRLYFEVVKGDGGDEVDPDLRVLRTKKANYGPLGEGIRLRWRAGAFVPDNGKDSFAMMASQAKADRVFLDLLRAYDDEGRHVSASPSANYAPSVFAKDPRAEGVSKKSFCDAMNRLFDARRIRVEEFGRASRRITRIVEVEQ